MERQQAEAEKGARPVHGAPAARLRPEREESTGGGGRQLVCARCRHPITTEGERIEIDGLHEHSQINPHGYIWNFGCFARAPGCVPVGRPSHEFAWFAGHWWQIEQCGGCALHLGWLFGSPDRRFHGLIVGRVVEEERPHPGGGSSPDA